MVSKIIHVDFNKNKKDKKESFLSLIKKRLKNLFSSHTPPSTPDPDSDKKIIYYNKGIS